MRVGIAGASGLIGKPLVASLESRGIEVSRLVRSAPKSDREIEWHPDRGMIDAAALEGIDALLNFAGDGIADGRWTKEKKRRIHDSRINGTKLLSETIANLSAKPKTFINACAIGFYGDRGAELIDEDSAPGAGFLAGVCREWEQATSAAEQAGIRVVRLRLGVVLTRDGGIVGSMLRPFKMGLGGKLGSGKQYISWITIEDTIAAINFILNHDNLSGPINLVAPQPATNTEFTKALGHALSRPTFMAMPAFIVRLVFGSEMANEMMLSSTRVSPSVLNEAGYQFQYPEINKAVKAMVG